jgi:hypothetical protein
VSLEHALATLFGALMLNAGAVGAVLPAWLCACIVHCRLIKLSSMTFTALQGVFCGSQVMQLVTCTVAGLKAAVVGE